jgi:hypothetical protein
MFRSRCARHPAGVALLAILLLGHAAARADDAPPQPQPEYLPGPGWQVPGTHWMIGGYASAGYEDTHESEAELALDHLSLFVHWEGEGKFRLFAELDLEDALVYRAGSGVVTSDAYFDLERLYGDYEFNENLNLRAGKFLTPIGRWNVIHADPLQWTTSRPLVTERSFPTNLTGVMAFGSLPAFGRDVEYSVYGAFVNDLRTSPNLDPFTEALGSHVTVPLSANAELGVSVATFEQRDDVGDRRKLAGMDYHWSRDRYEVTAEAVYRSTEEGGAFAEKGLFVQGVAPLSDRFYAVARYEFYDKAGPEGPVNLWLLGAAWKVSPALVVKLEYQEASERQSAIRDGVLASVSVLF